MQIFHIWACLFWLQIWGMEIIDPLTHILHNIASLPEEPHKEVQELQMNL